MSLKTRAILVLVIGIVMGSGLSIGGGILSDSEPVSDAALAPDQARLLAEVMERVKREFVEPIDDSVLLESAIRGMVSNLDPHSEYLDADEYRDIRVSTTGSYTGVGIEVSQADGVITVITPIAGSPAARADIRTGDRIVGIDGISIEPANLQETIGLMRGRAGTRIQVTVEREGEAISHELRREKIRVASVHEEGLPPAYGYVRVSQFSDSTARELGRAIDSLQENKGGMLEGLILDLRNNPGGVLDAAVDVSDLFLDSGVIVTANGRTSDARFSRSAHRGAHG